MNFIFWLAGLGAIAAATRAVTHENPIYSALWTLLALSAVAVEFVLLHSGFLAAMQVLLYAGAIMVLFVFVIMLLSLKKEEHGEEPPFATKAFAFAVALAVFAVLTSAARTFPVRDAAFPASDERMASVAGDVDFGSVEHFGRFLYGPSVVPFELISVLLTAAIAGVVILARRRTPLGVEPPVESAPGHGQGHGEASPAPGDGPAETPPALEAAPLGGGAHT